MLAASLRAGTHTDTCAPLRVMFCIELSFLLFIFLFDRKLAPLFGALNNAKFTHVMPNGNAAQDSDPMARVSNSILHAPFHIVLLAPLIGWRKPMLYINARIFSARLQPQVIQGMDFISAVAKNRFK